MKITILHYGCFRKFGNSTLLGFSAQANANEIRSALIVKLGEENRLMIEDSVLGNDTDILPDEFIIDSDCTLSILPPVCGG